MILVLKKSALTKTLIKSERFNLETNTFINFLIEMNFLKRSLVYIACDLYHNFANYIRIKDVHKVQKKTFDWSELFFQKLFC